MDFETNVYNNINQKSSFIVGTLKSLTKPWKHIQKHQKRTYI